jgi:DNA repair protein RecO (recombination protein O)
MAERIDQVPAYVLHAYPYRESSLIVETLSQGHGRVSLVARGARRAQSSLKARLLAFQPLSLSWFGKTGLKTLHDVEWLGGSLRIEGRALMCGFYLNELLLKLLPAEDPHDELFAAYQTTLARLAAGEEPQAVLRRFELDLLSALGYAQPLGERADGGAVEPARRYAYVFGEGVVEQMAEAVGYRGQTLLDMAAGDYRDPATLAESKQLMRALLNHYLADKPLMTRQLLIDLSSL